MAQNELARIQGTLSDRLASPVLSQAEPDKDWLLEGRANINSDKDLQEIFSRGREETNPEKAVATMALALNAKWGGDYWAEAQEVAQYLWDEYTQLGEGVHLVSKETGKVLATLQEGDVYQPALVSRESGNMAQPLPRIRPEIEGFLTTWAFESEREQKVLQALVAKGFKSGLIQGEEDAKLLTATRKGRHQMVQALAKYHPKELLGASGGSTRAFLEHFQLVDEDPKASESLELMEGVVASKSILGIQDISTTNLSHNRAAGLRGALVQGWVREIARRLSNLAHEHCSLTTVPLTELSEEHLEGSDLWVAPPEAVRPINHLSTATVLPVTGALLTGLTGQVGYLVIPKEFRVSSYELSDRWATHSALEVRLWVDLDALDAIRLLDASFDSYVV